MYKYAKSCRARECNRLAGLTRSFAAKTRVRFFFLYLQRSASSLATLRIQIFTRETSKSPRSFNRTARLDQYIINSNNTSYVGHRLKFARRVFAVPASKAKQRFRAFSHPPDRIPRRSIPPTFPSPFSERFSTTAGRMGGGGANGGKIILLWEGGASFFEIRLVFFFFVLTL